MTTPKTIHPERLTGLILKHGSHESPDAGLCFMEAVAWVRNMKHSDAPKCVAPTIRAAGIALNDGLASDDQRTTLLVPLIPLVVGTATTAADEQTRAWLATDFLVREITPAWLECVGLTTQAAKLRAAPPLTSREIALGLSDLLESVRQDAAAAGAAAGDAAWAAAGAAAGAAAWAAAWAAARDAAGAAARAAAGDAAWAAAGAAAGAAARAAKPATYGVMYAAAKARLQPTADVLNVKCVDLIRRMSDVGRTEA